MRIMTERSPRRGKRGKGVLAKCERYYKPLQPDFEAKEGRQTKGTSSSCI